MPAHSNCLGLRRRDCLKLGLGAALGTGLVDLLRLRGTAYATETALRTEAKSCILVWLDGGPTHYETFDPKPEAPSEVRGEFQAIDTKVTGMQFSEHLPKLASISDKLAVIRSIRHDQGNHGAGNHYMMTGGPAADPRRLRRVRQLPSEPRLGHRL